MSLEDKTAPGRRRWLDGGALAGWMGLIFVLSAQPQLPHIPGPWFQDLPNIAGHMIEYAVLALLWWRVLSPQREARSRVLLVAFILTLLYSISDEWHQHFVPNRHMDVWDIVADGAGAALALAAARFWRLR
ncbi:MAG: VanZ family protein [Anaerolineae bacterium]